MEKIIAKENSKAVVKNFDHQLEKHLSHGHAGYNIGCALYVAAFKQGIQKSLFNISVVKIFYLN